MEWWCLGKDIIVADDKDSVLTKDYTHVRVYWSSTMRERCGIFWKWFDYVTTKHSYKDDFSDLRIVIGFDS